uniref:Soluble scavenger receptor cysteine-rich domain-containing protein SSC5D n=1 Tax=Cyclopterus lumpus TaxID=8103 RepID=A0A8C3A699_CYCLU
MGLTGAQAGWSNVKLSDGPNRCIGRVELFDKGQWGTVCGESWDVNDANVACRQMDCGSTHKITNTAEYGHGTGQTWHNQIECSGSELTLNQCPQRPFTNKTCNTTSIAGLEVRLANGKDECTGRVEVRHGDVWQTVCDTDWTMTKAQMVCDHLECGKAMNAPGGAHFGQGVGSVVEASNSCFDNVTSLEQCSLRGFREAGCGHDRDAGALCAAQIRLVGGSSQCSGRVEIFYKGQWGTVCDDEWELANADVVCRQLGCGHAVTAPKSAHFGRGTGPIWLDNVECTGDESALTHCTHPGFGENNCGHSEDAGAVCLGKRPGSCLIYYLTTEPVRVYSSYYSYFPLSRTLLLGPLTPAATSSSVALGVVVGGLVVLLLVLVTGYLVWRKRRWGAGKWHTFILQNAPNAPFVLLSSCTK